MSIFTYAALWVGAVVAACLFDNLVWLRYVRPAMERSRGWPPVRDDERIPMSAAAFGGFIVFTLLFLLPWFGVRPGY